MPRNLHGLLLVPLAATLAACTPEPESSRPAIDRAVKVIAEPLGFERVRTRVEAVGTSRAVRSAEIYPATSGEVMAVNFEPGQRVAAGDVLVELERREEELAVRLAEVRLADAKRLYDRYQRSAGSGAVTQSMIDEAESAVETTRIELERARVALDYRTIEAPFGGYVGVTEVDPGDRIGPDTMITSVDDRSALLVRFDVPEAFVGQLGVGDTVELTTWSGDATESAGVIEDIGSRIDPASRTYIARARVDNARDRLRPGMSFRVVADFEGDRYPVVAETGVQWGADGAYVWTIVGGQAERVPVEIVQRREGRVLIDAPLDGDDVVVIEGTQQMREGVEVDYEPTGLADRAPDRVTAVPAGRRPASGGD